MGNIGYTTQDEDKQNKTRKTQHRKLKDKQHGPHQKSGRETNKGNKS